MQRFSLSTPRPGRLAAAHHCGGNPGSLANYAQNISHIFRLFVRLEPKFVCTLVLLSENCLTLTPTSFSLLSPRSSKTYVGLTSFSQMCEWLVGSMEKEPVALPEVCVQLAHSTLARRCRIGGSHLFNFDHCVQCYQTCREVQLGAPS